MHLNSTRINFVSTIYLTQSQVPVGWSWEKDRNKNIQTKNWPKTISESHKAINWQIMRAVGGLHLVSGNQRWDWVSENQENSQWHKHSFHYCLVGTYILQSKHNYDSPLIYEMYLSFFTSLAYYVNPFYFKLQ